MNHMKQIASCDQLIISEPKMTWAVKNLFNSRTVEQRVFQFYN